MTFESWTCREAGNEAPAAWLSATYESSLSVHLASLSGENLVWHVVDSDILVWPGRSVVLRITAGGGDRVPE